MNDSANEQDEGNELLKLSQPIYFEPISGLTNVFFDVDNQQIFCVRSNGVNIKIKFYFSKKLYLFWPIQIRKISFSFSFFTIHYHSNTF